MSRTIASFTALALLVAAAAANGASDTYRGQIQGDAKASVELVSKARDGNRFIAKFAVRKFLLECEGDAAARLARATLEGRARVSDKGRFRMKASNQTQKLSVQGRITRGSARGSVNYSGLTEFADQTLECRSGDVRWTASR